MTEIIEYGQWNTPQIFIPTDSFFDIKTVNQTFIDILDKKHIPVLPCDIPAIEKAAKLLHPLYIAHVTNENGIYSFSLIKNSVSPHDCIIDIIMYANQKIFINAKVTVPGFCWEYTQNTYSNITRQVSSLNGDDTVRVYDIAKEEYLSDTQYVITDSKDLHCMPQMMHKLGKMFGRYPYVIN